MEPQIKILTLLDETTGKEQLGCSLEFFKLLSLQYIFLLNTTWIKKIISSAI